VSGAIEIVPVQRPVVGSIRPPGSKSLTNRALIIAALAALRSSNSQPTRLTGVLDSVDTRVMIDSLRRLGWVIEQNEAGCTLEIRGGMETQNSDTLSPATDTHQHNSRASGREGWGEGDVTTRPHTPSNFWLNRHRERLESSPTDLWLENSGTSIRFLTALCAALDHGEFCRLDGNARMRERPIQPLVDALREWGAVIDCELHTGCPPVVVRGTGLPGGVVRVAGDLSSQYLSALLMVAPLANGPVNVVVTGELVSRPYVEMTLAIMRDFGATADETARNHFLITDTGYQPRDYAIEPDASAASYFFAAAAVTGGRVTVEGLNRQALQGDVQFAASLERMGCRVIWGDDAITVDAAGVTLRGIDIDMNAISDTAQTLAAVAPFAAGATRIRGVAHMRHKETDRVSACVTELQKLGLTVEEHDDGLTIHPGPMRPASIATYDDHRMAMSFAVLGLKQPGITIEDPDCTSKTYPEFFTDLGRLCEAAR
jgi:3-phosphoshikimate 1-carboxyvinyltransferase